jgi:hypothetical protein
MNSEIINSINTDNVMALKKNKRSDAPYYATMSTATSVLTDYDSFPYGRWFRGQYQNSEPIVAEREAGWRMREDACYRAEFGTRVPQNYPQHCFETACSTVYPCMTNFDTDFSSSDKKKAVLNRECVIQYR